MQCNVTMVRNDDEVDLKRLRFRCRCYESETKKWQKNRLKISEDKLEQNQLENNKQTSQLMHKI